MPITNPINEFVILKMQNLIFADQTTDEPLADVDKLNNVNLNDEFGSAELRGGVNNDKYLTLYGDRNCQLTADAVANSVELLKLKGNTVTVKTTQVLKPVKGLVIVSDKVTLPSTPVANKPMTIYLSNSAGDNLTKLTKAETVPASANEYSITGSEISLFAGTTGYVNAYYYEEEEREVIDFKSGTPKIYKAYGKVLLQSISTKFIYAGDIIMPAVQILPTQNFTGDNSVTAPSPNTITLDLLKMGDLAPYSISAIQE